MSNGDRVEATDAERYNAVTGAWENEDPNSWQQHPELIGGIPGAIGNYLFPTGYR